MDVHLAFKKAKDDVRVLIIHSTEDSLGANVAGHLRGELNSAIKVVGVERATDFRSLGTIIDRLPEFNVLLLIAHGDARDHKFWLCDDHDQDGTELGINAGELKAIFRDKVADKLLMFASCYTGTDDLAELMLDHSVALACIAPKPDHPISGRQAADGFAWLLNQIQSYQAIDVGPYELTKFVNDPNFSRIFSILTVKPNV